MVSTFHVDLLMSAEKRFTGPAVPFNNLTHLKLAVSEAVKKKRGQGTAKDRLERNLERRLTTRPSKYS